MHKAAEFSASLQPQLRGRAQYSQNLQNNLKNKLNGNLDRYPYTSHTNNRICNGHDAHRRIPHHTIARAMGKNLRA
jgi:hypothetical protein